MTNERAIELLNRISDSQFDGPHGDERREALSMAVRALEQNLVQESGGLVKDLVKDCISRKMAIDEVKRLHDVAWANWKETRISANTMIDALKDLPSAQPEMHDKRTETHACDLIDRQAVINAINTWDKFGVDERCRIVRWYEGLEPYVHMRDVLTAIVNLPAAQPQWIPCSEGLPEANGRYLVTRGLNACGALWNRVYIINYTDLMGLKSGRIWWDGNVGKSDFEQIDDVIAWIPLPKPYGGDTK